MSHPMSHVIPAALVNKPRSEIGGKENEIKSKKYGGEAQKCNENNENVVLVMKSLSYFMCRDWKISIFFFCLASRGTTYRVSTYVTNNPSFTFITTVSHILHFAHLISQSPFTSSPCCPPSLANSNVRGPGSMPSTPLYLYPTLNPSITSPTPST